MSAEARARLAAMQADLVAALAAGAGPPAGFDAERVRLAAASLASKRRQAVARAWPDLAAALADRFGPRFEAFAAQTPLPAAGGPRADGRAFAAWLARQGELPEACRLHALAVDLRYVRTAAGLRPRRGPALKALLLRQARSLVLAVYFPWLGERWLSIPLGRRRPGANP